MHKLKRFGLFFLMPAVFACTSKPAEKPVCEVAPYQRMEGCDTIKKIEWYPEHLDVEGWLCFLANHAGSAVTLDPTKLSDTWVTVADIPVLLSRVDDTTACAKTVNGLLSQGDEFVNHSTIREQVLQLMSFILDDRLFVSHRSNFEVIEQIRKIHCGYGSRITSPLLIRLLF